MRLLGPTFERTSLYGWVGLLAAILLGVVAGRIASTLMHAAADRMHKRGWLGRASALRHGAGLILAFAWFVYNLVALIDIVTRRMFRRTDPKLVETLTAMVRKALRIFLMVLVGLFVVQNIFEQNITAWLAGLGIAGLAVSLAAQDPIKNVFGSFTVLAERPFVLGDRIIFNNIDGTVEEIGFRSTRIRTMVGHLVTVPNMKFTDSVIENITRRPSLRRTVNVGVTYGTSPAKMEEAIRLIEGVLKEDAIASELNTPADPPRVTFTEMNADNLNIQVVYWYAINREGCDWWSYLKHGERVNLRIMQAFAQAGIEFAFPTQTVHVVNDTPAKA
jgi:MscS family membrane protein